MNTAERLRAANEVYKADHRELTDEQCVELVDEILGMCAELYFERPWLAVGIIPAVMYELGAGDEESERSLDGVSAAGGTGRDEFVAELREAKQDELR